MQKVLTNYKVILKVGSRLVRYDVDAFDRHEAEFQAITLENKRQNEANKFENTGVHAGSVNYICEPLQYQS